MKFTALKKVVIVTESVIKDSIVEHIVAAGAKGYTINTVYGMGESRVVLMGEYRGNVKIDIITTEEIANNIAMTIVEKFFTNYTGIVYIENVKVIRSKKFDV